MAVQLRYLLTLLGRVPWWKRCSPYADMSAYEICLIILVGAYAGALLLLSIGAVVIPAMVARTGNKDQLDFAENVSKSSLATLELLAKPIARLLLAATQQQQPVQQLPPGDNVPQ